MHGSGPKPCEPLKANPANASEEGAPRARKNARVAQSWYQDLAWNVQESPDLGMVLALNLE